MASQPPPGYDWVDEPPPRAAPRPIIPLQATPQTPAQDASARASAAAAAANANRTTAITPVDVQGQALQNQGRQRDLQLPPAMNEATTAAARERAFAAVRLLRELNDAEAAFEPYSHGTTAGEIAGTVLPYTSGLARFRDAHTRMVSSIRQLFRTPDASTTDTEGQYYESMVPSPTERDEVNRDRITQLRRELSASIDNYAALLPPAEQQRLVTQRDAAVRPAPGAFGSQILPAAAAALDPVTVRPTAVNSDPGFDPNAPLSDAPGQTQLSTSQQSVTDETRHANANRIRAMILAGTPDAEVLAETQRLFGTDPMHIPDILAYRRREGLPALRRHGLNIDPAVYTTNRDLTPEEQRGAETAQSPVGAAVGHFANAVTGGLVPLFRGGDSQQRLDQSRAQHPWEAGIGDALGSALPTTGIEAGLARGLGRAGVNLGEQSALRYLPRTGANTIYGATYGATSNPDDPLTGAALGGSVGAVGGEVGAAAPRALGTIAGGVRAPQARFLADRGVPLTPGQILRDTQGPVGSQIGRAASGLEQASTSLPIAGDAIADRYADSYRGALNAAHDETLSFIGGTANRAATTGEELMQSTDRAVSEAYNNAFRGVTLNPDTGFNRLFTRAETLGNRPTVTTEQRALLQPAFAQVREVLQSGPVSGRQYQAAMQVLREARAAVRDTKLATPAMAALDRGEAALRGMVRRQMPELLPAVRNADRAYRHASILRDAQAKAINAEDGTVNPGQFGTAIRTQTRRYGGAAQAASPDRPFYELQNAMRNVLPDRLPNSGTAARLAVGTAAAAGGGALDAYGGALSALPKIGAGLGAVRLAYSNVGRDALQGMLLRRPSWARHTGDVLQSPISQGVGAAVGRAYSLPVIEDTLEDDPAFPSWRPRQ